MVVLIDRQETASTSSSRRGDVVEVVSASGARGHHGTDIIGQPERALDGARSALAEVVAFGHEERHIRRQTVVFPGLNHVVHVGRLPVEGTPVGALPPSAHAGIVLEGEEREILQVAARLEVVHEPAQKRDSSVGVRPGIHVARRTFESRPAQRRVGHQFVDGLGELNVQRGVVFREHALPVRFLAHLDPRDRILPFVQVRDFVGRILRNGV